MTYKENLLWILDKNPRRINTDEDYRQNIEFVHSLGQKCDCVGWSKLDLSAPDADGILDQIRSFCQETGWKARGYYTREFTELQSDWYELKPVPFHDSTVAGRFDIVADDESKLSMLTIRAYHETDPAPKAFGEEILVSERFRNACLRNHISGITFCWAQDKGRYEAEQYFYLYADQRIPRIAGDRDLSFSGKPSHALSQRIKALGGHLPKIAEFFYDLHVDLPVCYLASDLPDSGIAYAYCPETLFSVAKNNILIHKDTAKLLLQEKAISPSALRPAPIVSVCPCGYRIDKTQKSPRPAEPFIKEMLQQYQNLKSTPRPVRRVSERDALKVLREAKRNRKEEFCSPMSRKQSVRLKDTPFAPLASYYLVSNGGILSDEYEFLGYNSAIEAGQEFAENLSKEELLEGRPDGVVFAKCADGDMILLCKDGSVIRFSHEVPEILEQWPSVPQFFFHSITEDSGAV